jgi:hypothetical protein
MKQFIVGNSYSCRSLCDYDCIFSFEVMKRTAKTVWLKGAGGKVRARRITVRDDAETVEPHGRYSMSPMLTAK